LDPSGYGCDATLLAMKKLHVGITIVSHPCPPRVLGAFPYCEGGERKNSATRNILPFSTSLGQEMPQSKPP